MKIGGIHPIEEALAEGRSIEKVFVAREEDSPAWLSLSSKLRQAGVPVKRVPRVKLDRMFKGHHQGVVAVISPLSYIPLEKMVARAFARHPRPAFLLADGITDTRNLGALIRSAAAFAFDGIILPASGSASLSAEGTKTSAGALFKIPVSRVAHLLDAVYYLQSEGVEVVAATEKTSQLLEDYTFRRPVAVVLGNEHKGIQPSVLKAADTTLKINISSRMDSLNVSVAGAIFMYEINRQLGLTSR